MVQSCFINALALWVIYKDKERRHMDWRQRVWGYTGAGGMVQGFAAGYFAWDLLASAEHVDVHGWGALAHAFSALSVSMMGFVCYCLPVPYRSEEESLRMDGSSDPLSTITASTSFFTSFQRPFSTFIGGLTRSA